MSRKPFVPFSADIQWKRDTADHLLYRMALVIRRRARLWHGRPRTRSAHRHRKAGRA